MSQTNYCFGSCIYCQCHFIFQHFTFWFYHQNRVALYYFSVDDTSLSLYDVHIISLSFRLTISRNSFCLTSESKTKIPDEKNCFPRIYKLTKKKRLNATFISFIHTLNLDYLDTFLHVTAIRRCTQPNL